MAITSKKFNKRYVRSGDLRHRITFYLRSVVPSSRSGESATTRFEKSCTVWSAIETATPRVPLDGVETESPITHRFYIRYLKGVDKNYWIEHDCVYYQTVNVRDLDGNKKYLRIDCIEKGDVDISKVRF